MTQETLAAQLARACCADFYQSDAVRLLVGDSFHPGGERLTRVLAERMRLGPDDRVLDVGCGRGASALLLAREWGCRVVGIDFGEQNLEEASRAAADAGLADRATFRSGEAEALAFDSEAFDAVICECVLSTFPDKVTPIQEMRRVLAPKGRLGVTDVTLRGALPEELQGIAGRVACIGGALSGEEYAGLLDALDVGSVVAEDHSWAVADMLKELQGKLLLARMASTMGVLDIADADLATAQRLLGAAEAQVSAGNLGYGLFVAVAS